MTFGFYCNYLKDEDLFATWLTVLLTKSLLLDSKINDNFWNEGLLRYASCVLKIRRQAETCLLPYAILSAGGFRFFVYKKIFAVDTKDNRKQRTLGRSLLQGYCQYGANQFPIIDKFLSVSKEKDIMSPHCFQKWKKSSLLSLSMTKHCKHWLV